MATTLDFSSMITSEWPILKIIIGVAIIIAAILLKSGKPNFRKSHKQETSYEETYKNPLKAL
mgnify:CR=1 FL=1